MSTNKEAGLVAAKATLTRMCADPEHRRFVIRRLLSSVELADRLAPESWAVTQFENGFRLNVGTVEAFACIGGRVLLLMACHPVDAKVEGVQPIHYASIPAPQSVFAGTPETFALVSRTLDDWHDAYVRGAALGPGGRPRRCRYGRFHSPSLLEAARGELAEPGEDEVYQFDQARPGETLDSYLRRHRVDRSQQDGLKATLAEIALVDRTREFLDGGFTIAISGGAPMATAQPQGNFYNGYSWRERMRKYHEMRRRLASGALQHPTGPCRLCGDPGGPAGSVEFEYHDEDYSQEYSWDEPASYVLCHHCHMQRVHMRFTQPLAWRAFLAHVRRGGYARDLEQPVVFDEVAAYRRELKTGRSPSPLKPLRPYSQTPGEEWFAKLSLDGNQMLFPGSRPRP